MSALQWERRERGRLKVAMVSLVGVCAGKGAGKCREIRQDFRVDRRLTNLTAGVRNVRRRSGLSRQT